MAVHSEDAAEPGSNHPMPSGRGAPATATRFRGPAPPLPEAQEQQTEGADVQPN